MDYAAFERRASRVWEEIPDEYRSGVDGLVLEHDAKPHPGLPDIYTLGECLTETYISDWGGPETTRSVLVLYYGSFLNLSRLDSDFDWRYEIWETITHELRHHLESLAAEDALEDVDYAVDENFKRLNDEPFDPFFFRSGEPLAPGVYQADRDVFIEIPWDDRDPPGPRAEFSWHGALHTLPVPPEPGDVTFIQVVGGVETGPTDLCVVLVRRKGFWGELRRMFGRIPPRVVEVEATARAAP